MKDSTLDSLLNYLGDLSKWPFLWDGTMGGKYQIGGAYFAMLNAVREGYVLLVATPFGIRSHKADGTIRNGLEYERPSTEFIDAFSLIISRDWHIRPLIKKAWQKTTDQGLEVAYSLELEEFAKFIKQPFETVRFQRPEDIKVEPAPIRRMYIPTEALAQKVEFTDEAMQVFLKDGRVISTPMAWFPALQKATSEQRSQYEVVGGGLGLFWPELEEDILVASLLAGGNLDVLDEISNP